VTAAQRDSAIGVCPPVVPTPAGRAGRLRGAKTFREE
jgi:hypothetical protein